MTDISDTVGGFEKNYSKNSSLYELLPVFDRLVDALYSKYSTISTELPKKMDLETYAGVLFVKYLLSGKAISDEDVLHSGSKVNLRKKAFIQNMRGFVYSACKKMYAGVTADTVMSPRKGLQRADDSAVKNSTVFLETLGYDVLQFSPLSLAQKIVGTGKIGNYQRGVFKATQEALSDGVTLQKIGRVLLQKEDNDARFRDYNSLVRRIDSLHSKKVEQEKNGRVEKYTQSNKSALK